MASINKVQISPNTYEISLSPDGVIDMISNDVDQSVATSYVSVNKINNTDTNSAIFGKITSMIRNLRYVYNVVGDESISGNSITESISGMPSRISQHIDADHQHLSDDPVLTLSASDTLENSTSSVPTSSVVYAVNADLDSKIDLIPSDIKIPAFTTNVDCGNLLSGTHIQTIDGNVFSRMLVNPNTRTSSYSNNIKIDTWNSLSDVDDFFEEHNPQNNWKDLVIGQYITINDGTYNCDWVIVGFDLEHQQTASDNTVYDNGHGICMMPRYIGSACESLIMPWDSTATINSGGYKSSLIHTTLNSTVYSALKTVCGSHIKSRRVLLWNNSNASSFIWTTAYLTLSSVKNFIGMAYADDGEAYYEFPNYLSYLRYSTESRFWLWLRNYNSGSIWAYWYDTSGHGSSEPVNLTVPRYFPNSNLVPGCMMYLR